MERLILILLLLVVSGCSCRDKKASRIEEVEDSIRIIDEKITSRNTTIDSLICEKDSLISVERKISLENEKTDSMLVNGDWLQNIEFISEYLSKHQNIGN